MIITVTACMKLTTHKILGIRRRRVGDSLFNRTHKTKDWKFRNQNVEFKFGSSLQRKCKLSGSIVRERGSLEISIAERIVPAVIGMRDIRQVMQFNALPSTKSVIVSRQNLFLCLGIRIPHGDVRDELFRKAETTIRSIFQIAFQYEAGPSGRMKKGDPAIALFWR